MKNAQYPYIVAELGCNHNGDIILAKQMITAAKRCGCDAIKLQLWSKEELFTDRYLRDLNDGKIRLENVSQWKSEELGLRNIFDQVRKFSIGKKEHAELFAFARRPNGLEILVGKEDLRPDSPLFNTLEQLVGLSGEESMRSSVRMDIAQAVLEITSYPKANMKTHSPRATGSGGLEKAFERSH